MFKYTEEKEDGGGVAFDYDHSETPMYEMAQEYINDILVYGYDGYDDQESEPDKKTSARHDIERPIYKEGWDWNGMDHRRSVGC